MENLKNIAPNKWIPCSEREPDKAGLYQTTYISTFPVNPLLKGTEYDLYGKRLIANFRWDGEQWDSLIHGDVIAWNPYSFVLNELLKEPYEGD